MGKKKESVLLAQREGFLAGTRKNNIDDAVANKVFDLMVYFAGYGFNKSHSAAYAYVAYQTAYLKAHYRPEFMNQFLDHSYILPHIIVLNNVFTMIAHPAGIDNCSFPSGTHLLI